MPSVRGDRLMPLTPVFVRPLLSTFARYLSRYQSLSRQQKNVLWASLFFLPLFWLGLRFFGLQRFQGWLDRSSVADRPPLNADQAATIGAAVNIAATHAPGPVTCLTRSLLLRSFLRRLGTDSELRVGVQFAGGEFAAHAWVEVAGQPINDAPDIATRYAAFDKPVSTSQFS